MPQFSVDWTSHHFSDWSKWLGHLRDQPARGLEIGCFEGRSAVWFFEHVLTHEKSELICIDPWCYDYERMVEPGGGTWIDTRYDWEQIAATFRVNTEPWSSKRRIFRQPSQVALHALPLEPLYDFAFIDGSHVARCVLEDAVAIWPRLKTGGVLIFDDYDWNQNRPGPDPELLKPRLAIDSFCRLYADQFDDRIYSNGQVKIRRVR